MPSRPRRAALVSFAVVVLVVLGPTASCRTTRDDDHAHRAAKAPSAASAAAPAVDAPTDGGPIDLRPSDAAMRDVLETPATGSSTAMCQKQMGVVCLEGREVCGRDATGCERCTCVRAGDDRPGIP